MPSPLHELADNLPSTAGVYLFRNQRGKVLYVGKAINLRSRVKQYLAGTDERQMVPHLVAAAKTVDVVLTRTEKDALLLENTLIKEHRPRFNIRLRDDSNYLQLRIDTRDAWPRYTLVRRIKDDGARYFGPFHSASRARQTLAWLQRAFPLRTCTDQTLKSRRRPCLLHQMGRCVAPCVDLVSPSEYATLTAESMLLLEGRHRPLITRLRDRMTTASENEEFEAAARLRDLMRSIEATLERQEVVDTRLGDRDIWGLARDPSGNRGAVVVLPVREGMMSEPTFQVADALVGDDSELLSSVINAAYPDGAYIPPEIVVPTMPLHHQALCEVLSERRGKKVSIGSPSRGPKHRLLQMANDNAAIRLSRNQAEEKRTREALERLAKLIGLSSPPRRIECFDNSNLQGTNPVAAMSVFIDGVPARAEYRRYRVKTVIGSNDYATMMEILGRRLKRGLDDGVMPDLLVVDGGHGQLNIARAVLEDLGLEEQPVIGISKPRTEHRRGDRTATDKLVLPGLKDPLRLRSNDPALRMIQHLRDEVHNHAIRYHRRVRRKVTLTSVLESIGGIGPARRRALITALGSADGVADATLAHLTSVPGIGPALAKQIYDALHPVDM